MTGIRCCRWGIPAVLTVLVALVDGQPLNAQSRQGEVSAHQRSGLTVSIAAGPADLSQVGLSRSTNYHGLIAVGFARRGFPLEVRAEAMAVSNGGSSGTGSLSANGVLPVGRLSLGGGVFQPYAIGGVGVFRAAAPVSRVNWNAGGGVRFDRMRYGLFSEVRVHQAYEQTFANLGFTWRR